MNKKILIVEDDKELAEAYRYALEQKGFQVHVSTKGTDGLEEIVTFRPDVLLLDLLLPKMLGHEIMKAIHENVDTNAKIVVLSNYDSRENVEKAFDFGVHAFLSKRKFPPEKVVERVQYLLKKDEMVP